MQQRFDITSNFEFYCYLKAHLPTGYSIVPEPSASYYTEWAFQYFIYCGDELFMEFCGNYLAIGSGYLVREAKRILRLVEEREC